MAPSFFHMNDLDVSSFPAPPAWSLATGQAGRVFVLLAAALFAVSAIAWLLSPRVRRFETFGKLSFTGACLSVFGSFLSLAVLFVTNRFEFEYVYGHNDTKNAVQYRIAGIWSGQEGSFLLWATCTAAFALLTIRLMAHYRRWATITTSFFLGGIASILAFESPFRLNMIEGRPFVPFEGLGLAPSLQNYWVVIHPPTIFLGFGSLTVLFALAVAAMAERDYEAWIPIVRPWAIVSITLVGLGLCMGGFWAYETLGWGGFWMWDPVENVSFVPWVFGIAFVHGVIVQAARKKWHLSNLLLAGLPFLSFIYGTFLTRSGFLSEASVHSFAEMDQSALKLLMVVMAVCTVGFVGLWSVRAFQARKVPVQETKNEGIAREGFYVMGITSLLVLGAATMIGMSVPLMQALKGQKPRVVEEGLYHQVLVWIFVPLMILMAVTPFVSWRKLDGKALWSKVYTALCLTIGLTGLLIFAATITGFGRELTMSPTVTMLGSHKVKGLAWPAILLGICLFAFVANTMKLVELYKRSKLGVAPFLAHVGVAVLMVGLVVSRAFEKKDQGIVMADHPAQLLGYEVKYGGMTSVESDRNNQLRLEVYGKDGGTPLFTATPGVYKVTMGDGQQTTMVWPHIQRGWFMDTYVALGEPQTQMSGDVSLKPGQTTSFGGLQLTYVEATRDGEFGVRGTQFGAKVLVKGDGETETVHPKMEIAGGGSTISHPAPIDKSLELVMSGMNAADKSVTLRMQLKTPMYPIEIFHKPLTILVWLGTALMTVSGFLAAYYRRTKRVMVEEIQTETPRTRTKAAELVTAINKKPLSTRN